MAEKYYRYHKRGDGSRYRYQVAAPSAASGGSSLGYVQTQRTADLANLERQRKAKYTQAGNDMIGGPLSGGGYLMSPAGRAVNQDFGLRHATMMGSFAAAGAGAMQSDRQFGLQQQQFGLDQARAANQSTLAMGSLSLDRQRLGMARGAYGGSRPSGRYANYRPAAQRQATYSRPNTFVGFRGSRAYQRIHSQYG